ncbi:CoA transferase [Mycolicibacterium sp. GCM10028919]|uniref:CoA transferase n=1 Tax=Mycolicibacterium sp. GCM10028919 TaxID=3273401 RepID=UPI003606734D
MDALADDWGASGLAYLTGDPTGPPDYSRAAVLAAARAVAAEFETRTGVRVDAAEELVGRAALLGLTRRGATSAGGASRLLPAADGWWALTLSRPDDVDAVPALVESDDAPTDPWRAVRDWSFTRNVADVVERARLLDLPAAALGEAVARPPTVRHAGPRSAPRTAAGLVVVDLSSMWAGPSCGRLLLRAGATVVKVESRSRPDGSRGGPRPFFDWVNGGKLSYTADFDDGARLRELLAIADVVIESSRPAALRRRGLGPDDVAARDGRVWLSITGYADTGRVAFGDDAAVAGGLVGQGADGPVFCADAVADPLTGLHAALEVVGSLRRGGGETVHVVMSEIAATYSALPQTVPHTPAEAAAPTSPAPAARASDLDVDRTRVDRLIDERRLAPC